MNPKRLPDAEPAIDWLAFFRDTPILQLDARAQWNRTPLRCRSDIEDAAAYLAMGRPTIMGIDFAQRRGRSLLSEVHGGNRYWFLDEIDTFPITITKGNPMQDQTTPTKQFVTKDVPGFPDGTQLHLSSGAMGSAATFSAYRKTDDGIEVRAQFYLTPESIQAHVRVKDIKPPKVEKKA